MRRVTQCLPSMSFLISSLHAVPHVFPPCPPSMSSRHVSPPLSSFSSPFSFLHWRSGEGLGGELGTRETSRDPPHRAPSLLQSLPRSSWSATECGRPRKQRHDVPRPPKATKIEPKLYLRVGDWRSQGLFSEKMPTSRSLCYLPYETHADQLENQHLGTL